jgi:hypothetical protein
MDILRFFLEKKITIQAKKNLFILPHQGLGDHLLLFAYVIEMKKKYNHVILVIKKNLKQTLEILYSQHNIIFYEIENDNDISPNFGYKEPQSLQSILEQFNFIKHFHYLHSLEPIQEYKKFIFTFPEVFYREYGLDENLRFNFKCERNLEREQMYYKKLTNIIGDTYAVIHDDHARNFVLKNELLPDSLEKFHISLGTKNTNGTDVVKSNNIFDYITILENAEEIHIFDSFLAIFIDLLKLKCKGNIFFHKYIRIGDPRLYQEKFIYLS